MYRAILISLLALLVGCTATPAPQADQSSAPQAGQSSVPQADQSSAAPASADPSVAPTELPVLASQEMPAGQSTATVEIRRLKVTGQTMTLTFSVTLADSAPKGWSVGSNFSGPSSPSLAFTVAGVAVVDGKNAERYLPALDDEGGCVCSSDLAGLYLEPGQTAYLAAVYQAVPEDVTTVDVVTPHAGTFNDIPVER